MDKKTAFTLPALTLAYIGDGIYETAVREYYLNQGVRKVEELHKATVSRVCANFQSQFYHEILPLLSDDEEAVLKRARNAHSRKSKSANVADYHKSTAVEALFGALYLSREQERLAELTAILIKFIERSDNQ